MTIKDLRVFVTVARKENITNAAAELFMSQPQVSLIIKNMESELGFPLFIRAKARIHLSKKGEELLSYANKVLLEYDGMMAFAHGESKKRQLTVSSSLSIGEVMLARLFEPYEKEGEIAFSYCIEPSDKVIEDTQSGKSDLGFIEGGDYSKSLYSIDLSTDRLSLVSSMAFPVGESVSLEEFEALPLLLRNKGSGSRQIFDGALLNKQLHLNVKAESVSNLALIDLALHGFGVAVVPFILAKKEIEAGRLKETKVDGVSFLRHFTLILKKNSPNLDFAFRLANDFKRLAQLDTSSRGVNCETRKQN